MKPFQDGGYGFPYPVEEDKMKENCQKDGCQHDNKRQRQKGMELPCDEESGFYIQVKEFVNRRFFPINAVGIVRFANGFTFGSIPVKSRERKDGGVIFFGRLV